MAKRKTNQIILYGIVAVMVLSMGTFGIGSAISGARSQDVIIVGGSTVDANTYANSLQNNIRRYEDSAGKEISMSEAELVGLPELTIQSLTGGAVLEEIARTEGIRANDVDVAKYIQNIDAFKKADGSFDRAAYDSYRTRAQVSTKDFEDSIHRELTKDMVNNAVLASTPNFDAISLTILKKRAKRIGLDYLELTSVHLPEAIEPPTDAEMQSYYDENKELFMQEEIKRVDVAFLSPETVGETLSDDDVKAAFDADKSQFVKPETRDVLVLAFPTEDGAKAITAEGFEDEIAARGLSTLEVSESLTKHSDLDETQAAIFAGNQGDIVGPFSSDFGYIVYKIMNITPAVEDFDALKQDVRAVLAQSALEAKIDAAYDNVVDAIANGGLPKDIAAPNGLEFATLRIGEDEIDGLTNDAAFESEVAAAQVEENRDIFTLENGGVAYLYVDAVEAPEPLPFEDAKDDIKSLMLQERETLAKEAFLDALTVRLNNGETLEDIAGEIGVEVQHQDPELVMDLVTLAPISLVLNVFDESTPDFTTAIEAEKFYIAERGEIVLFDENDPQNATLLNENNEALNARMKAMQQEGIIRGASQEYGTYVNRNLQSQVHVQMQ